MPFAAPAPSLAMDAAGALLSGHGWRCEQGTAQATSAQNAVVSHPIKIDDMFEDENCWKGQISPPEETASRTTIKRQVRRRAFHDLRLLQISLAASNVWGLTFTGLHADSDIQTTTPLRVGASCLLFLTMCGYFQWMHAHRQQDNAQVEPFANQGKSLLLGGSDALALDETDQLPVTMSPQALANSGPKLPPISKARLSFQSNPLFDFYIGRNPVHNPLYNASGEAPPSTPLTPHTPDMLAHSNASCTTQAASVPAALSAPRDNGDCTATEWQEENPLFQTDAGCMRDDAAGVCAPVGCAEQLISNMNQQMAVERNQLFDQLEDGKGSAGGSDGDGTGADVAAHVADGIVSEIREKNAAGILTDSDRADVGGASAPSGQKDGDNDLTDNPLYADTDVTISALDADADGTVNPLYADADGTASPLDAEADGTVGPLDAEADGTASPLDAEADGTVSGMHANGGAGVDAGAGAEDDCSSIVLKDQDIAAERQEGTGNVCPKVLSQGKEAAAQALCCVQAADPPGAADCKKGLGNGKPAHHDQDTKDKQTGTCVVTSSCCSSTSEGNPGTGLVGDKNGPRITNTVEEPKGNQQNVAADVLAVRVAAMQFAGEGCDDTVGGNPTEEAKAACKGTPRNSKTAKSPDLSKRAKVPSGRHGAEGDASPRLVKDRCSGLESGRIMGFMRPTESSLRRKSGLETKASRELACEGQDVVAKTNTISPQGAKRVSRRSSGVGEGESDATKNARQRVA